jgi:hypothetical protein
MSKQFTYVIDEQCLRGKLRGMSAPLKEEAWVRFNSYAVAHARPVVTRRFQRLNIPLNRNTILPAAFAVIIIFFSFLLFNFIDIKNPKKAEALNNTSVPLPQIAPNHLAMPADKTQNISTEVQNKEAVQVAEATIVKEKPVTENTVAKTPEPKQEANAIVADESLLQATAGKEVQRTRKRRAEDIVGIKEAEQIRPTVVTEDMDPEVRPN